MSVTQIHFNFHWRRVALLSKFFWVTAFASSTHGLPRAPVTHSSVKHETVVMSHLPIAEPLCCEALRFDWRLFDRRWLYSHNNRHTFSRNQNLGIKTTNTRQALVLPRSALNVPRLFIQFHITVVLRLERRYMRREALCKTMTSRHIRNQFTYSGISSAVSTWMIYGLASHWLRLLILSRGKKEDQRTQKRTYGYE